MLPGLGLDNNGDLKKKKNGGDGTGSIIGRDGYKGRSPEKILRLTDKQ